MSLINKHYQAHLITPNTITVVFDSGPPANVLRTNSLFDRVAELLRSGRFSEVPALVDRALQITTHSKGKFNVRNGVVVIDGEELPHALSEKLLQLVEEGQDTAYLENFWDNLKDNPSKESAADLYEFLEHNKVPITRDGCFVVYKKIGRDYKDLYTRTIDNTPGRVVTIPRGSVDPNREHTCSTGLHVAAFEYASDHYGSHSDIIVECKVNPADVVAVPPDYNQQKMRVCRYEVVRVVDVPQTSLTYQEPIDAYDDEEEDDWLSNDDDDDDDDMELPVKPAKKPVPKTLPVSRIMNKFKPFEVQIDSNGRLRVPGRAVRKLDVGVGGEVTAYVPRGGKSIKLTGNGEPETVKKARSYSARDDNSVRLSPDLLALIPNGDSDLWKVSLVHGELKLTPVL